MAALTLRTNSFGLVSDSASQFGCQWRRSSSIHGNLNAEAMFMAIAVLPAPEVPITTTRICPSLVRASDDIELRSKDSTPVAPHRRHAQNCRALPEAARSRTAERSF